MGNENKTDTSNESLVDDDRVDALIRLQSNFIERAKKALVNFKKDSATRKTLKMYYTSKIKSFGEIVKQFELNHRELVMLVPSNDQVTMPYFKSDSATIFEDAQIDFITAIQAEYDAKFPEEKRPPVNEKTEHLSSHINLPTISIPHFSGAHTDWKQFHDVFKSIVHTNEKLPGSHKFQYLLGALAGEARDLVTCYEVCDDDYPKAWKSLCEVYNDKPSMFIHIMNKFTSLESVNKEHSERLRELVKATDACLKSLDSIGVPKTNVDPVITYSLIRKLPAETLAYWEQIRDRKELPAFESLKDCIETRIRVSAAIATVKCESHGTSTSNERAENNNRQSKYPQKGKKVNAYHSSAKSSSTSNTVATNSSQSSSKAGRKFPCPVCNAEGHPLRTCDQFLAKPAVERKATITKLQYCANCLAFNHQEAKCRSSHTCFSCGERHHSLLHVNKSEPVVRIAAHASTAASTSSNGANIRNTQTTITSQILLATAMVTVLDVNGTPHSLRALIDQGSDANFISEATVKALQLKKRPIQAIINGIGSNGQSKHTTSFTIKTPHDKTFKINIEAFVMGRITSLLPTTNFKPQIWSHVTDLTLADPSYHRTGRIDLILGAEVLAQIIMEGVRIGPPNTPIAQQTRIGWILSGKVSDNATPTTTVTALHATSSIEALMEKFMAVESVEDASQMSTEEQWCEQFFVDTHRRDETGRFTVRLPFRELFDSSTKPLGRSRDIAVKSLLRLERRFAQNPELKKEYSASINEYLTSGRMRPTTPTEIECDGHIRSAYLPHHPVIKESSTSTRLRIVFDASRPTNTGKSLNDSLVVGPTIQNNIVTIIINWRFHRIGCTADVQKMYLQVKVDPKDIEFQRIVYRNEPTDPIQDFALNRLTFGTSCAPFIAIRSVMQLAEDEKSNYPEAANVITNDAYVDDVISGGDDVQAVQKLQRDLSEMMKAGCFDLKKWASNVSEVLKDIPESDREIKLPVEIDTNDTIKALGIAWNTATDSLCFKSSLDPDINRKFTKRTALSTVAKVFDPVGLIAPIIVVGKIFMKKVWSAALGWDDALTVELSNEWIQYIEGLRLISAIKIPRWINTTKHNKSCQLHGFSDASEMAYGAAIYLRTVDQDNETHIHLIASKSKVAPKKTLTIPRLELCGAQLLSNLLTSIRKGLRHVAIQNEDIYLWCDSEIVCYWLRSNKSLKVFVGNRVAKIHEATTGIQWRHVRTHDNPADLVSRGSTPEDLANNELWWHGPSWLKLPKQQWPVSRIDAITIPEDIDPEHRREVTANVCIQSTDIIYRFSSYNRLVRVSAWCKRFSDNCRHPAKRNFGNLSSDELAHIHRHWIRHTQTQHFNDEIHCLNKNVPIDRRSKLLSLTPFIDGNQILRVRGRIEASMLPYEEKHPAILPPNAIFTHLLIDRVHRRSLHGGTQLTMSLLQRNYWIINARNTIRHRLHKCITCFKQRAETAQQLMGRGIKTYKGYIAVFVCLTVRAMHVECVDGLSTDAFLAAFRRFVSRRGLPSDVYSDNGTNFVGAANELGRQFQKMTIEHEKSIADKFIEDGIKWHFIPPGSPHFGGMWEAGVKSVKFHVRRSIGESKLTYEEMHTLLCQVEACVNSRPLCALSTDPHDLTALTPGHFLVNTDLLSVPEPSLIEENPNRLHHWQLIQQLRQSFWARYIHDCLSQLQQRPKWQREQPNLNIGQLVLVQDDRLRSAQWPLGRIIDTHPGDDGNVRVVTVRTASGVYKRNVTRISPLPIDANCIDDETPTRNEENEIRSSA